MPQYIRCPRCELNFIDKKEKFCSVCKKEMKANGEVNDNGDLELCPICHFNIIEPGKEMCEQCQEEIGNNDMTYENEKEWRQYIGEEDEDSESLTDEENEEEEVGENASILDMNDEDLGLGIDDELIEFDKDSSEFDVEGEESEDEESSKENNDIDDMDFEDDEYDDEEEDDEEYDDEDDDE